MTIYPDYPKFDIDLVTDNIVSGRLCLDTTDDIVKILSKEVDKVDALSPAYIGEDPEDNVFADIRKGSVHWLEESKEATALIDRLVEEINTGYFNLNISDLAKEYQYTVYADTEDHYDWHQDRYDTDTTKFVRELSISVCLSSSEMYDGAEFFIKDGKDANVRVFKMKYGDFIVFPSACEHRVNMLREGKRISLVIWYGHWKKD